MSITRQQMERDARNLITDYLDGFEFSNIYEADWIADDYTGKEQRDLMDLIILANVAVSWKDAK